MKDRAIDLLIIVPPARSRRMIFPPYGAMCVASALRQKGYNPKILNADTEQIKNSEVMKRVSKINPKYIGFTGMVVTSYKYIKTLSLELKQGFPNTIQILGGALSNAAEPVLKNTAIDIVVHGEGEITACDLMNCLDMKSDLNKVPGIYYKKSASCIYTGKRPLIRDLDTLSFPAFDLVDMNPYFSDGIEIIHRFTKEINDKRIYDKHRKRRMISILTNRGCIGSCTFCVRPDPGVRMPSIKYLFDFVEYCIEKFDIGFFTFADDCFAPNRDRNWQFIDEYRRRKLDIIFRIQGLRVDTVDKDILRAYREIGCCMINYGFETGSQKMLNVIDKRIVVEQNRNAALWTREAGIFTPTQLILGMPGETNETIRETISFLKSLNFDYKHYKCTYALPVPGSDLYNYARLTGAIEDEDKYLCSIGEIEGTQALHVNLTEEEDAVVGTWRKKITEEMNDFHIYKRYKIRNPIIKKCIRFLEAIALHIRLGDLLPIIKRKLKLLLYSVLNIKQKKVVIQQKYVQFRKKKDINIEEFLKGSDCSSVNRDMSLKKINERLKVD